MIKNILITILGLGCGIIFMIFIFKNNPKISLETKSLTSALGLSKPEVIGFLPYWLIGKNDIDYSKYLNTISYFGLTVDTDGTILKRTKPTESEPGWLAINSGKMDPVFEMTKKKNLKRSLVIFNGNQEAISQLISDPVKHGQNLIDEISPVIAKYGFTDLNLDIESVMVASESARKNFTIFTKTVHDQLKKDNNSVLLSIDVSPIVLFKPYLTDVVALSPYVDKVIFMVYDFHFQGSSVTGAVSPVGGAGTTAEFDTEVSIKEALNILSPEKIIVGVPLYGYEWETLTDYPHAAVIPGTGIVISNQRAEDFLGKCASCSAKYDAISKEAYLIYKDQETNTFHQFFYPDAVAMQEKINLIKKYNLGGIALWALGYEGKTILESLKTVH